MAKDLWLARIIFSLLRIIAASMLLISCQINIQQPTSEYPTLTPTPNKLPPLSKVTFTVNVFEYSPATTSLFLDVLDEVTGLALNPLRIKMNPKGNQSFSVTYNAPFGSIIKYRYVRDLKNSPVEVTTSGTQVRYRLLYLDEKDKYIDDLIAAWADAPYTKLTGRIVGRITKKGSQDGIGGVMISIAGLQTLSDADGTFILEGLPIGTHNLVAYSLDGLYQPFQQGVVIAPESTTPVSFQVVPNKLVKIHFKVHVPKNTPLEAKVRLIGNIYPLGNTFADLRGGMSVIASRAPLLEKSLDYFYSLSLDLPIGVDLRYKYTLGDGFWNSEQTNEGRFRIRQLFIPDKEGSVEDNVDTWQAGNSAPITFRAKVPDNTPAEDTISIQFNPYGWTEPIPMWRHNVHEWSFTLFSPLNMLGKVGYRFCRNDQCGIADDEATGGLKTGGYPFSTSLISQFIEDDITNWKWWDKSSSSTRIVTTSINPRGDTFITGIEWLSYYHPSWMSYINLAVTNVHAIGSNWIFLSPSWTLMQSNPPVIELIPGKDMLWQDVIQTAAVIQRESLNLAIFPRLHFQNNNPEDWWGSGSRNEGWWQSWFDRYEEFILHHATIAMQTGAKALVIGGPEIYPALPGALLEAGEPSGAPEDIENRWKTLIKNVKSRYQGILIWALPYDMIDNPPSLISEVDQVYILWSTPNFPNDAKSETDSVQSIGKSLDTKILPLQENLKKPIILGIQYPSNKDSVTTCLPNSTNCVNFEYYNPSTTQIPGQVDLSSQVNIYNAVLFAINQRTWINGIVARGYFPPVLLQDKSPSIHGKPASDIIWYWFPRLRGEVK